MAVAALAMFAVMFLVIFVLRSAMQKRATGDSGIRAGALGASVGSLEWLAGWLLVIAMLAAVGAPIAELAGLEPLTDSAVVRGIGAALAAIGIVATFLAQTNMGEAWRIGIDEAERTELVSTGAFELVRNPIFSAMILSGVGLTIMVPNPLSISGILTLVVAIELQVRHVEEPHLRRLHGADYAAYEARVGRFVPGLGLNRDAGQTP